MKAVFGIKVRKKRVHSAFAVLAAAAVLSIGGAAFTPPPVEAASPTRINTDVTTSLDKFHQEVHDADSVLQKAKAVLVFPNVYQGGVIVGGQYGEGALLVDNQTEGYYNLISASYGLQLGGQKKTIILAFMTDESLANFRKSEGWKVGADASVAIMKLGAEGSIDSATLNKPVVGFVIGQKGLMYNLSLEGSKISKIDPK